MSEAANYTPEPGDIGLVEYQAVNTKRLKAARIDFDGPGLTVLGGKNEQGKSSCLDALLWLFCGEGAIEGDPIALGEDAAYSMVKLTDGRQIKRTFKRDAGNKKGYTTKLELLTADGGSISGKQTEINSWLQAGGIAFDPLSFSQMDGKKRRAVLAELVGIDLDAFAARYKEIYDKRAAHSAIHRAAEGKLNTAVKPQPVAGEIVDVAAVNEELAGALKLKEQRTADERRHEEAKGEVQALWAKAANAKKAADDRRAEIARLQALLIDDERAAAEASQQYAAAQKEVENWPPYTEVPDIAAIQQKLADADSQNAAIREQQRASEEYTRIVNDFAEQDKVRSGYTAQLEAIEKERTDALAAAEYPVDGLSFGDDDVLLDGLPFANASMSQRLKLGMMVAVALNPALRVITSHDGSLADSENRKLIHELAKEHGFWVVMEAVQDEPGGNPDFNNIFIEDGSIVGAVD